MKERRSQVTNELQKMEKGRRSGQVAQNLDKGQWFEVQSVQDLDVGEENISAYCTLPVKSRKGGNWRQSFANPERFKKPGRSTKAEIANRLEGRYPLSLDGKIRRHTLSRSMKKRSRL